MTIAIERILEMIFWTNLPVFAMLILKMIKKCLADVEAKLGSPALSKSNIDQGQKRVVVYFPHLRRFALFPARP